MDQNPDLRRLQQEYARRAGDLEKKELYSSENPAHQWMISDRQAKILDLLDENLSDNLSDLHILEIGCGSGGVIDEFIQLGATPVRLTGIDLLFDRLELASTILPACSWINANGQYLPFQERSFDLILQFTAFSSILNFQTKNDMAAEMLRVLKPGGIVLWYDFTWNPTNPQTKGIRLKEVKVLFPGCRHLPSRITLAPPLVRLLLPRFPLLVDWLSSLRLFNSHLLIWIKKTSEPS